jgi:hypothetical protein
MDNRTRGEVMERVVPIVDGRSALLPVRTIFIDGEVPLESRAVSRS